MPKSAGHVRYVFVALGRSTVAHFARKVRGANIMAAQHELKIQQSHAQERWLCSLRVRGPHFASKVSYSASPQSLAAKKFVNSFNSLLRRLRPKPYCGAAPQPRCKNSINSNLRRERPERASSPQPRATPWVSAYKRPRPVRAKVWANG